MYRLDGTLMSMFRGNGANVLRIAPAAALQLLLVEFLRRSFPESRLALVPSISGFETALIGGAAGIIATPLTYPLDYLHGRLSVQNRSFEPYRGVLDGLNKSMAKVSSTCEVDNTMMNSLTLPSLMIHPFRKDHAPYFEDCFRLTSAYSPTSG